MDPRTKHLIKNFALSGAAVGGSAALLTSAVNYIKYLKEKAQRDKGTDYDDSVMYIDIPEDGTTKKATVAGGVALTSGVLAALGTYMLGRNLYQKVKKKKLQKDLDETQQLYLEKLNEQAEGIKSASEGGKPMSTAEVLTSSPFTATLLAAIASGVVTNRVLEHHYPSRKRIEKKDSRPKAIRVRYTRNGKPVGDEQPIEIGSGTMVDEKDMTKDASDLSPISEADILQSEMFLCDITLGMAKSASYLPDIIFSIAEGRIQELEDNITQLGVVPALEMIKGASDYSVPRNARKMAINLAVQSEVLRPVVTTLAAAEFFENCPNQYMVSTSVPLMEADALVKMAAAINALETEEVIDEAAPGPEEEIPEGVEEFAEISPRDLLQQLMAAEMEKTPVKKEKKDENDVIDKMLAAS